MLLTIARTDPQQRFALCFDDRLARDLRSVGSDVRILGAVRFSRPWTVLQARSALRRYDRGSNPLRSQAVGLSQAERGFWSAEARLRFGSSDLALAENPNAISLDPIESRTGVGETIQSGVEPPHSKSLAPLGSGQLHITQLYNSYRVFIFHGCWTFAALAPGVRGRGQRWLAVHDIGDADRGAGGAVASAGPRPARHWVERLASRTRPDGIIANSRATANAIQPLFPKTAIVIIPPPVPLSPTIKPEDRERIRREQGAAPQDVVIAMVARWEPIKGHSVLIEALARLRDRPEWTAWIIGGPQRDEERSLEERIHEQARALGIADRVRWLGSRDDAQALLGAADLYCQPNLGPEGFGITFVEAMRAGLPVVTTPIGGAADLIDPTRGVAVSPGNSEELSTALADLIADPERRSRLGAAGRDWANARFQPEDVVRRWRTLSLG